MLGDGDAAPAEAAAGEGRARKKRAYDAVSGAVSQRPWKAPFGRASSIAVRPPPPPGDWEVKMAEKERKRGIQDAVRKLKDEAKAAAAAERARRADVKKRKEQNRRKSSGVQKASRRESGASCAAPQPTLLPTLASLTPACLL